jgi:hypothetical protein
VGWRWPFETRVFAIRAPAPAGRYRLRFPDGGEIAEAQLLVHTGSKV